MKETITYGLSDKKHESFIENQSAAFIENARQAAIQQSDQNLPPEKFTIEQSRPFIGNITSDFQSLVDQSKSYFLTEGKLASLKRTESDVEYEQKRIAKTKGQLTADYRVSYREYEKKGVKNILPALRKKARKTKLWTPLVVGIVMCDALVSSTVLQKGLGYPLYLALVMGITVAGGLFALAHMVPQWMHKVKTNSRKIGLAMGVSVGVCLIFYIFSSFREDNAGKYAFMVINYFCFFCAGLICYTTGLTPTEKEQLNRFGAMQDSLDELEKQIGEHEQTEQQLQQKLSKAKEDYEALLVYAKSTEKMIVSHYDRAYTLFQQTNIFHRSDGVIPAFFSSEAPLLTLHFS